ncbi:MAG: tetratricopeptide repeat protein [Chloroflexota bacterium]
MHAADEVGDLEGALAILEESRPKLPDAQLHRLLVGRYLDLPLDRAELALREWWDAEHDRFSGGGLAHLLVEQGRKDEALAILNDSQGAEAWPEYWRLLALLRDETGEPEAAASAMELYTRLEPQNASAWMTLAEMQQRLGQIDRALLSLRRAGDAVPESIAPRAQRATMLAGEARWAEVRDAVESLLEGEYEDATLDMLRGLGDSLAQAYFVLGDFDAARHIWTGLLADRRDDVDVRYQLANLELQSGRYRQALLALEEYPDSGRVFRVLDVRLRATLALHEFDEATHVATQIEEMDESVPVRRLVAACRAGANREYAWALEQLEGLAPSRYGDLWHTIRLDCLARLGRWSDISAVLRGIEEPNEAVIISAALGAMAAGKLDLAQHLLGEMEDQQSMEARALNTLLGPLRQSKRASEARRQQQIDAADKQRWAAESRELRRQVRDLERHNAALADALARSEAAMERLLELVGVSVTGGMPADWEAQLLSIGERAHKDALHQELLGAEQRLRSMLGRECWDSLSEGARLSLREGEWLFEAVQGEDRDYGAALLEYARGLERAFKDAIFVPIRVRWERDPGPINLLQTEGLDPSLGPFARYVLVGGHLTLGSMAAAMDRMSDGRRRGVAIDLLRRQVKVDAWDERCLADWKRASDRLAIAADARNQPAHAGAVSREAVRYFRDLVLGTDGLLRALLV